MTMELGALPPQLGALPPQLVTRPPGEHSRTFLIRHRHAAAPMGPPRATGGIVYATATGANVVDVDGNRYVDLAAGFGAALLGHGHPSVRRALALQAERLWHALGDLYPSDAKIALCERLAALYPEPGAQVIVAQSGSDAVSAALKTAALHTGRAGVVAFSGAYHGLGYGPLAACGLRASYREPFTAQLNPNVRFCDYPAARGDGDAGGAD
ncbi:MAG TPA: aminotransferase class III-fold pyridoxal phosphate-dependent enzyme, partial [Polyangiaceae bacterium]|nr:aminotransferase class III-fold pyridoxal phosphate-dependent enzyme [Polyangiaceae bacterium]